MVRNPIFNIACHTNINEFFYGNRVTDFIVNTGINTVDTSLGRYPRFITITPISVEYQIYIFQIYIPSHIFVIC